MTYDDIKLFIKLICIRYNYQHDIVLDIDHRKTVWGSSTLATKTCYITKRLMLQPDCKIKQTVIHECIHIIYDEGHSPKFRRLQTDYLNSIGLMPEYEGRRSTHIIKLYDKDYRLLWHEDNCKRQDETKKEYI